MADQHSADEKETEDKDHRVGEIARVVKDYLREGETFTVQCLEDEIIVEETVQSKFAREHPRLYGRLLSVNEQMDTGCGLAVALFFLGGVFCFGLHVGWWNEILPAAVTDKLRTWWFYVPLFALLFVLADAWGSLRERRVYRRGRHELLLLLRSEGYDRDTIVPVIQGVAELERISKQLRLDPGPFVHEGG